MAQRCMIPYVTPQLRGTSNQSRPYRLEVLIFIDSGRENLCSNEELFASLKDMAIDIKIELRNLRWPRHDVMLDHLTL